MKLNQISFYKDLPLLETERLILRKLTVDDVNDYFDFASDAEVTKFLRWGPHPNKEYTTEYIQGVLNEYINGKDGPWGLEHKIDKKIIGIIHLMELDTVNQKAQIGFVLTRSYWNNGHATETLNRVLEYCFTNLMLNKIGAFCISENTAAIRVMEKVGMQQEGLLSQDFSISKDDYYTRHQ